jgi:hypothetical protein
MKYAYGQFLSAAESVQTGFRCEYVLCVCVRQSGSSRANTMGIGHAPYCRTYVDMVAVMQSSLLHSLNEICLWSISKWS